MKAEVRVPTTQYGYINIIIDEAQSLAEVIDYHNMAVETYKDSLKTPSVASEIGLKSIDMLRLVHKYLVTQKLELEDIESLGTLQTYSQRDIIGLLKNVMAKISREEAGTRADSKLKEINID